MKSTLASRLKTALERLHLSQTEAAKICGISQQSLNYIINNDLDRSKLGTQIASSLGVNPEWLVLGKGKFLETSSYELPIITSYIALKKYQAGSFDLDSIQYTLIDVYLGDKAFAFQTELNKIVICATDPEIAKQCTQFLCVSSSRIEVKNTGCEECYPIFEWRVRNGEF